MTVTGKIIHRLFQQQKSKHKDSAENASQAAMKALEHLEQRMKQVSEESNKFANQYRFGGMVAIIALLNADLLLDESIRRISLKTPDLPRMLALLVLVVACLLTSWVYFSGINRRVQRFNQAYRKTKHKYEVLLYGLLMEQHPKDIMIALEGEMKAAPEKLALPAEYNYQKMVAYLNDHHARAKPGEEAERIESNLYWYIVALAISIKIISYILMLLK